MVANPKRDNEPNKHSVSRSSTTSSGVCYDPCACFPHSRVHEHQLDTVRFHFDLREGHFLYEYGVVSCNQNIASRRDRKRHNTNIVSSGTSVNEDKKKRQRTGCPYIRNTCDMIIIIICLPHLPAPDQVSPSVLSNGKQILTSFVDYTVYIGIKNVCAVECYHTLLDTKLSFPRS